MNLTQVAGSQIGVIGMFDETGRAKPSAPIILIADPQTSQILDYITAKNIISDNHKKSLEDTLETFNFITFADKRFSEHLEKRNRIIIPDEDNNLVEFVPFEIVKYRDSEGHKIQVYSHASYLEIKKANVIYPNVYEGTATQHLGRALNDTGWRLGTVESGGSRSITFDNHTNPFAYIKRIARELDLEPNFRIEHDGRKITGRYVDLLERVGAWRNRTVEFGKDLQGIRRVEKQDIYTALLGVMPEDEEGNQQTVLVEDEEALQRWGRIDEHGELQHLIGTHEIQSTRSDMTESEAIQYTRTELNKRINTTVTYEANIVDLEHVPGMQNKQIRHGDTIRIKDTKFNPPLYLEARVFESDGSIKERGNKQIKLGDFVEFTQEEVDSIWQSLREQIRKRITAAELADYTYKKIEIDDKDESVRSDVESYANTVSSEAKDEAITYTNNTIEPIVVSVGNLSDSIDDIESDVSDHANQITQAQTDITQAWDEINLKAEKTEVDLIESRVSTAESELSVQAGRIDAKADSSTVTALGTRVSTAETNINAIEGEITSKVDVDGVVSIIHQESDNITLSANQINFDGHVFGSDATFTGRIEGSEISGSSFTSQGMSDRGPVMNEMVLTSGRLSITPINNPNLPVLSLYSERMIFEDTSGNISSTVTYGMNGIDVSREVGGQNYMHSFIRTHSDGMAINAGGELSLRGNDGIVVHGDVEINNGELRARESLQVDGLLRYNRNDIPSFSGSSNLRLETGGTASTARIGLIGSRRELKRDIETLDVTVEDLSTLKPIKYRDKAEYKNKGSESPYYYGLIAEEVAESNLIDLADFSDDGTPVSVNYDRLPVAMLPTLLNHEDRLKDLETENQLLKNEIKIIKEQIK